MSVLLPTAHASSPSTRCRESHGPRRPLRAGRRLRGHCGRSRGLPLVAAYDSGRTARMPCWQRLTCCPATRPSSSSWKCGTPASPAGSWPRTSSRRASTSCGSCRRGPGARGPRGRGVRRRHHLRRPPGADRGLRRMTPWNYPLMMAVWKWAPAVAAGNTVVLKPADLTPASTVRMAQLLAARCFPRVFSTSSAGAPPPGEHLVADPRVSRLRSPAVSAAGRAVATAAAQRLARVHLELGGNAPAVVFADADLAAAVGGIVEGAYLNAGQDCTAAARVLVAAAVHDQFLELLTCAVAALRWVARTRRASITARWSARRSASGCWRSSSGSPTMPGCSSVGRSRSAPASSLRLASSPGSSRTTRSSRPRSSGLVTVQSFDDEDEALELANGVPYGLTASVWTADHGRRASGSCATSTSVRSA